MGHPDYKEVHYKPQVNEKEAELAGWLIGKAFNLFFKGTFGSIAYGGATVFDTLRMKTATADFFAWQRGPAMWLGLLSILCLATGVPGYYLMLLIGGVLAFFPGGAFVLGGLTYLPIPVLNALLAIPVPAITPRVELMRLILEPGERGQELLALSHSNLAGIPLIEWYTRLDWASLLIPAVLTLLATVKYVRLARARNFIDDDECECLPTSPVLIAWFGFALLLVLLGLPGAPFGLWTLLAFGGWSWLGRTKNAVVPDYAENQTTSGASFDLSDLPATPVPPPTPRPAPTGTTPPLRDFEEAEQARKKNSPLRRTDYDA